MDWTGLSRSACAISGTPCFVFSERPLQAVFHSLGSLQSELPLRHWLSLKTQPIKRLVEWCREKEMGIEVVSEFELAAVLSLNVPPSAIVVNGVGKHHWLSRYTIHDLNVHVDSVTEARAFAGIARALAWRVGLRCAIPQAADGLAAVWDQFGMVPEEVTAASAILESAGVRVSGVHFHLHANVGHASEYGRALEHLRRVCTEAKLDPDYIDIGGGLPISGEHPREGRPAAETFEMNEFREVLRSVPTMFPGVREVWLENGRFLTGAAGALVVSVLDKKDREGRPYLICDGGRVNHARVAASEIHGILLDPNRGGPEADTVVCGPTCGAIDRLGAWSLPRSIAPGDLITWLNAGAYHIPLETRFSYGLAPVIWFNRHDEPEVVRARETPTDWWRQWTSPEAASNPLAR